MDYVQQIFGKPLRQITYQEIADYFQAQRRENNFLEFKSVPTGNITDSQWDGILQSACAFLNSSGGVIVWGAPKEKTVKLENGKKIKECQGPLTNFDTHLPKDTVVSKISTNLTPLASGFQVEILENGSGSSVCIIELQQSTYSPHQTGNKYFMRLDGQTVNAPHHYIEALIKKIAFPNLEGYLKFNPPIFLQQTAQWETHYVADVEIWIFNFSPMENEEQVFFSIVSNLLKPIDRFVTRQTNIKPDIVTGALVGRDVVSVLMNGHPYHQKIPFEIKGDIDTTQTHHFNFILQFAGKKSPLKYSRYSVELKKEKGNLRWYVKEMAENRFINDDDDSGGFSRADQLRHFAIKSGQ
ncbi:MAG TPA: ATP-binding protein [Puia sp.]|nr:ATP-binding protein [Puia sp.]